MLKWYETVFDARVQYQNPGMAFFTYDDEHHRFRSPTCRSFLPDGTEAGRQGTIGVDHVAYTYGSVPGHLGSAELEEKRHHSISAIHHRITPSLYYADPDRDQMELQVDCCSSSDEARR